jgi:SAM-dependent methyltransferase
METLRPRVSAARGRVVSTSRHVKSRLAGRAVPIDCRISADQWDKEFARGDWNRLDDIAEVAHYAVILGFLDYGVAQPRILDVGCGHGRLTRLLARFGFSDYLGIDFSVQAVQRAEALSIPDARFEVTDMNHWDTTDRFDAVVLNESLYYADHPLQVFERALGWLTEDGIVIVSMFEPTPGASQIWSQIMSRAIEPLAATTVTDRGSGNVWDIQAMRRTR